MPIRHTTSRHHSHSVSLGTLNSAHRVTRRKSMTSSTINSSAAMAAAMAGRSQPTQGAPNRRSLPTKIGGGHRAVESSSGGGYSASHTHSPFSGTMAKTRDNMYKESVGDASAIADDFLAEGNTHNGTKSRARRASEGSYLTKSDGKRSSGELRCEKCGKGYKHSSCLTKHLSVIPATTKSVLSSRLTILLGGSILQSGPIRRNFSSRSTSKSSSSRLHRCLLA